MRQTITPLLALLVVLATVPLGGALAQAGTVRTVDDGTRLATDAGVEQFEAEGQVTGSVEPIQLDVSVHRTAASANASGLHIDPVTTYIRVDYAEDVPRTVRLHLDGEIVAPRPKAGLEPIGEASNATADLSVADDGATQSVVLRLTGETHAVFATNDIAGTVTGIKRTTTGYVDQAARNLTGIGLPTFGGGEWQYVESAELSGTNVSEPLASNASTMTVQYQASNDSWYSVPECAADAPVCTLDRNGTTLVVSTTDDAPRVRYKEGTDLLAGLKSAVDDATEIPDRTMDWMQGLLGGG